MVRQTNPTSAPVVPHSSASAPVSSHSNGHGDSATNGVSHLSQAEGWGTAIRQPMAWGLENMIGILQSSEERQRAQLDSMHLSLKRHQDIHERLQQCHDVAEMAALQAELMRFMVAHSVQLAQRCMDVGMHSQSAWARLWSGAWEAGRNSWMGNSLQAFQSGIHTGFKPIDDILAAPLYRELFSFHANQSNPATSA